MSGAWRGKVHSIIFTGGAHQSQKVVCYKDQNDKQSKNRNRIEDSNLTIKGNTAIPHSV